MKISYATLSATALGLVMAQGALAQNAEFTAVYNASPIVVIEGGAGDGYNSYSSCSVVVAENDIDVYELCVDAPEPATGITMTSIKVAQSKELLVGVSAVVSLFTSTEVSGKRGSKSTAIAHAEGSVKVMACEQGTNTCHESVSGPIMLASRTQELSAVLGGVIETCDVTLVYDQISGELDSAYFDLADCQVANEEIGLIMTTESANHYNFLFPNLRQGTYDIRAVFETAADTQAWAGCTEGATIDYDLTGCLADYGYGASAAAGALIANTTVTVQEVRAVRGWNATDPIEIN